MVEELEPSRTQIVNDLLAEKTLWQVYRRSRSIRFSRINNLVGLLLGGAVGASACWSHDLAACLSHLAFLSTLVFNTTVSLLGFLLAGFSFFATVADKSMFCRMAEVRNDESGLSFLKHNLFVFMRVFVEFLVLCIVSLVLLTCLDINAGARQSVDGALKWFASVTTPRSGVWLVSGAIGLVFGCFVYLLMQLKSFIFNVYHVVMTSIAWALENEPQQPESELPAEGSSQK